ncbi:MAG: glutamate racemase [Vampirovibrio sp.]|nr:glutamate racemase [Vampirovibrio sp.]
MPSEQPDSSSALPSAPIGFFDSGVGGLSVLDTVFHHLRDESYLYLADTQHMPYGERDPQEIVRLAASCLTWLVSQHQVKMLVVACNTASVCLPAMLERPEYQALKTLPIINPITPTCRWVAEGPYRRVGVIATMATVLSKQYVERIQAANPKIEVQQVACELLATFIEHGKTHKPLFQSILEEYLAPLIEWEMDALILGCTHYSHIGQEIRSQLPDSVDILDPADFIAHEIKQQLKCQGSSSVAEDHVQAITFRVTGEPNEFEQVSDELPMKNITVDIVQAAVVPLILPETPNTD